MTIPLNLSAQNPTPEFLLWSLRQACPLRSERPTRQSEWDWRQLRPLQEFSLAQEQSRIFEGICVQSAPDQIDASAAEQKGFRADEMLAFYGGQAFVSRQCSGCPANAAKTLFQDALAGCAGLLPVDATDPELPELFQIAAEKIRLHAQIREEFRQTTPGWYGFWCESPLNDRQLGLLERIVQLSIEIASSGHKVGETRPSRDLLLFRQAIRISRVTNLLLDIELFPSGLQQEKDWVVAAHCPRCKGGMTPSARNCRICGRTGHCHPVRKRRSRGDRPFWPLRRFLGEAGAIQFLARYRDSHQLE